MRIHCIATDDVRESILLRMEQWLCRNAQPFSIAETNDGFYAEWQNAAEREAFLKALTHMLCRDLRYPVLLRLADPLPLSLSLRRKILLDAARSTAVYPQEREVQKALDLYTAENNTIHLEGFLRFRLQPLYAFWRDAVEKAAEAVYVRRAYIELMTLLRAFVSITPPRTGKVTLLFHTNGGCTITDANQSRLDCPPEKRERLLSLLIGLAPRSLFVYALSGQEDTVLLEALGRVFAGKIRFFHC